MRSGALAVLLWLGAHACGGVETDQDSRSREDVCNDYCDHAIECNPEYEDVDCQFFCSCMFDSVRPEVAPDFVRCQADVPCSSPNPQQSCGIAWGGEVELTPAGEDFMAACRDRIETIGVPCPPEVLDCSVANLIVDDLLDGATACLQAESCEQINECVFRSFFAECFPYGPGP